MPTKKNSVSEHKTKKINKLFDSIISNWPFRKSFKFRSSAPIRSFFSKSCTRLLKLDMKDYLNWLYYFKGWTEPDTKTFPVMSMFCKAVLFEYEEYLKERDKDFDCFILAANYYKRFPEQRRFRYGGVKKFISLVSPLVNKKGLSAILSDLNNYEGTESSPWKIFNLSEKKQCLNATNRQSKFGTQRSTKGSWDESASFKRKTDEFYSMLNNKSLRLTLSDRGRKMMLSVGWGRQWLKKLGWTFSFFEKHSILSVDEVKKLIGEYDSIQCQGDRVELLKKYDPDLLDADKDYELDVKEKVVDILQRECL